MQDHNENGHTPLMEAASAGHCIVARILLEFGAGINTHSNEFKVKMAIKLYLLALFLSPKWAVKMSLIC